MKEPKKDSKGPKNKAFLQWTRTETCKHDDNIQSTDWHERLKRLEKFAPVYDNKPINMVYLLSGEYGRIWQKERDDWYKNVFVPEPSAVDMENRKRKVRMEAKAAKKAAEASAKERKQRKAKELEAKAKAEAEKLEKLKERVRKLAAPKSHGKTPKKKKETKQELQPQTPKEKTETCPKGWKPVELTLQCECSDHKEEKVNEEEKTETAPETNRTQASDQACTMCEGYVRQIQDIHEAKMKEDSKTEPIQENGTEVQ